MFGDWWMVLGMLGVVFSSINFSSELRLVHVSSFWCPVFSVFFVDH